MEIEADDIFERLAAYSEDEGGGDRDDGGGDRDDGGGDSDDGGGLAALQDRYDADQDCEYRRDNLAMARRVLACMRKRDARHAEAEEIAGAGSDASPTFSFLLYPAVVISSGKFYKFPRTFLIPTRVSEFLTLSAVARDQQI